MNATTSAVAMHKVESAGLGDWLVLSEDLEAMIHSILLGHCVDFV